MPSDDDRLAALLGRTLGTARFAPGFADRVADRVRHVAPRSGPALADVLPRHFRRLVPAALAASLTLAATNWWSARDSATSPVAGAIGLPPVTLAAALTLAPTDEAALP